MTKYDFVYFAVAADLDLNYIAEQKHQTKQLLNVL
jgi:hypothetical protein